MNANPDAIVIGGGVIGCSIAYHLAKLGVKTTLLERGQIGMAASNAASGALSAIFGSNEEAAYAQLVNQSLAMFHQLAPELAEQSGIDIEFAECGELNLAISEDEASAFQRFAAQEAAAGSSARWLNAQDVHALEPELNPLIPGGIYTPEVCRVNNQRLSAAFARSAMRLGADVRQASEVIGLVRSGLRITGVRLNHEELSADHIIIAAGPWSTSIAEWVGGNIPVRPVRGVNLNLIPQTHAINTVIHGAWGLLVPRNDGSVIAGATVEEAGYDCRVTAGAVQDIIGISATIVPSLRNADLNWATAGLRPGSPDDTPMLGAVPGWDGLLIASGHYRSGILLSPITGRLLADHIVGEKPKLLEHFSPKRFRVR